MCINDLESHAVLIVGYDDIKQAVALIDPWNKGWGGTQGGRWWMPYHILSIKNVDGSMGVAMCLTPLEVKKEICWDAVNNLSINLQVGFYVPRGTVMDLQSWKLTEVKIDCTLPDSWGGGRISHTVQGDWIVGDMVNVSLPIINSPEHEGEIQLAVNAKIEGKRPYDFADNLQISDSLHIGLPQSRVMEPEKNFIGSARGYTQVDSKVGNLANLAP